MPATYTIDQLIQKFIDENNALKKEVEDEIEKQKLLKVEMSELGSYTFLDLMTMSPEDFNKIERMRSGFHPKSDNNDEESDDDDEDPFGADEEDFDPFKKL